MDIKNTIKQLVASILKLDINEIVIEKPKDRKLGDYALPCFNYAKTMGKNPHDIALIIADELKSNEFEKVEVVGPYLNIFLNKKKYTKDIIEEILIKKENYGNNKRGIGKNICIDYSSPNIAKPFGVGHLRTTVIGESLKQIFRKNGYTVYAINYLGDYGTQFGKLIYAYKEWGSEEELKKNPIDELKRVYVLFHEEALKNPEIEEEGRKWFKALEDGDEEAKALWALFKEESLKEFAKTYELLNIEEFDSYDGEAYYSDKMEAVIEELKEKKLLVEDDGALVVRLGTDLPPALIKKSDGASLYITRDLASVFERKKKYDFSEALYVVGNEQTLHFNQLKKVVDLMGYDWYNSVRHINFGLILQDGKKMATRQGKSYKLHDLLDEAITLATAKIQEKNPDLESISEVAKQIGVGAVIFNDLKNYRTNDIEFNLEDILKFEGETGPYLQYTYARINSLINNNDNFDLNYNNLEINEYIWNIIFRLYDFQEIIIKASINYDPSLIAKYLIDLAQDFNKFYANVKIMATDEEEKEFNLAVAYSTSIVIKEGMKLLGIEVPKKM